MSAAESGREAAQQELAGCRQQLQKARQDLQQAQAGTEQVQQQAQEVVVSGCKCTIDWLVGVLVGIKIVAKQECYQQEQHSAPL